MNKTIGKAIELWWKVFDYLTKYHRPWWITTMTGLLALYGVGTYWWLIKLEGNGFSWESAVEIIFCISYVCLFFSSMGKIAKREPIEIQLMSMIMFILFPVVSTLVCMIGITGAVIALHLFGLLGQGLSMQELLNVTAMPRDWQLAVLVIGFYAALGVVLEVLARLYSWIKRADRGVCIQR